MTVEAEADALLAADSGITVEQLARRRGDRNRKWEAEIAAFGAVVTATDGEDAGVLVADDEGAPTDGDAKGVLAMYLYTVSRLLAPSRAHDTKAGALSLASDRHLDALDMERWAARQSDATKRFLYDLSFTHRSVELAEGWGVSKRTVERWRADIRRAIEADDNFTPGSSSHAHMSQ
ncbi:MAG TPA: hypothetical protein VMP86_07695 [Candidatus Binatia bacterium]|nr:hypothetical protein [Candidatus Binatia bacterium]